MIHSKSDIYKTEPEYFIFLYSLASEIFNAILQSSNLTDSKGINKIFYGRLDK